MAQAMAGQQSANMQAASADIARQEASNQAAKAQMAGSLQMAERSGAEKARAAELDKTETMLGMSQARLGAANAARDAATNSIIGGVTGLASSVLPAVPGLGEVGADGEASFMSNLMGKS